MVAQTRTTGGNSESRGEPDGTLTDNEGSKPSPIEALGLLAYTIFGAFGEREIELLKESEALVTDDEEASAPQRQYLLDEEQKDRLICTRLKDGETFTPVGELDQVFIAKPQNARRTVWENETREGILYTYPDPDNHSLRIATRVGEDPEVNPPVFQRYVNPYIPGFSIIYAIESEDGTNVDGTTLQDQNNDARQWAIERPLTVAEQTP